MGRKPHVPFEHIVLSKLLGKNRIKNKKRPKVNDPRTLCYTDHCNCQRQFLILYEMIIPQFRRNSNCGIFTDMKPFKSSLIIF